LSCNRVALWLGVAETKKIAADPVKSAEFIIASGVPISEQDHVILLLVVLRFGAEFDMDAGKGFKFR
jgi:hypothetical protein